MPAYDIVVLPGDGIGPEVVAEAVKVLSCVERLLVGEIELRFEPFDAGAARWQRAGSVFEEGAFERCREADAVLLGAMGLPDVRYEDGREIGSDVIFRLRFGLDLYAGLRPARLFEGVPGPLRDTAAGIDYVIVRESTEGLYASRAGGASARAEAATDTSVITRAGTARIAERAFELARRRDGRPLDGRSVVTCVDKANVLASYAFFRSVVSEVAARYEDVAFECLYVDAAALALVQRPSSFDVIVTENMFGDILSDLSAATVGGMGLAPSADVGDRHGLFQPAHGSAPDIVGRGLANPLATILSAAMMLDWLGSGRGDAAAVQAGRWIEEAVRSALSAGQARTPDLGGSSTTSEVGDAVVRELEAR